MIPVGMRLDGRFGKWIGQANDCRARDPTKFRHEGQPAVEEVAKLEQYRLVVVVVAEEVLAPRESG
jgi:hypothetical protein